MSNSRSNLKIWYLSKSRRKAGQYSWISTDSGGGRKNRDIKLQIEQLALDNVNIASDQRHLLHAVTTVAQQAKTKSFLPPTQGIPELTRIQRQH